MWKQNGDKEGLLLQRVLFVFIIWSLLGVKALGSSESSVVNYVSEEESRFPGFKPGQYGWGFLAGQPFSVRYQSWVHWKRSWFADVGYQIDQFLNFDVNYAFYFINEDDRWKFNQKVGTLLISGFVGAVASIYLGKEKDEDSRLGIRAGGTFSYLLPRSKWAVLMELTPVLYLSGPTTGGVQGGIGVIYYFDSPSVKKSAPFPAPSVETNKMDSGFDEFNEFEDEERDTKPPRPIRKKTLSHQEKMKKPLKAQHDLVKVKKRELANEKPPQEKKSRTKPTPRPKNENKMFHIEKFKGEESEDKSEEFNF